MRLQCLASKASLLVVLLGLLPSGQALAQIPAQPANPIAGESPAEQIVNSPSPTPSSVTWFDNLFSQKLPVEFGFHVGEAYSDNIYFQPKKTYDYVTELAPSLVFTLGQEIKLDHQLNQETLDNLTDSGNLNYLQVTYRPTLTLYDKNPHLDVVDEYADATYTHLFGKLTLSLEQKYEKLSQPTIQINAQGTLINRDIYTTTAHVNYICSDQLSTYGTLSQTVNSFKSNLYTDNTEWVGDYYFLDQLFPKLSVGFGPRIGFDDIDQEPNQKWQAGLVHLYFLATGKLTLSAAGGAEIREFEHDSAPTEITPIVEGTLTYQPFDSMTIKLDGERHRIVANGQPGDDYTASIGTVEVRQRFFQIIYLIVAGGFENDQYSMTNFGPAGTAARDDNIFFMNTGLEWASYRGITVNAGYSYLRNDSNFEAFTFTENRFTVSATLKY